MFCNDLNTILGVSVNYLRNMYISSFLENHKKMVADGTITQQEMNEKRKELAKIMAHSIVVQETMYTKFEGI